MEKSEKYRKRTLSGLAKLVRDENSSVARNKRLRHIFTAIGWIGILVSFLESLEPHIPIWAISVIGIVGGLSLGLAIFFESILKQWPTMKTYLDKEKILKDYETLEP